MAESSVSCSFQSTFIVRKSSDSSSENTVTPIHSSPSSTENYVPSRTCDWTGNVIDKLGLRYECKQPLEIVIKHMANLAHLFPDEVDALEEVANKLGCRLGCVGYFNCESLINIPVHGLCFLDQIDVCLLQRNVPFEEIDILQYATFTKKFGYSLWYILKESQDEISEAKYQCLFEEFLQMFGIKVLAQPELNKESAEIFRKKVSTQADILCLSQRGGVVKCSLAVCEVKKDCCSLDEDVGPTSPKLRRTQDSPENVSENTSLPDGLSAQHIAQLLTYFHRSFCNEAILGMTVKKTLVTFSRLFVKGDTMEKIKRSRESVKVKEEERPILYYSKPYNYLLEADRKEIVKTLLALTVLENRSYKYSYPRKRKS